MTPQEQQKLLDLFRSVHQSMGKAAWESAIVLVAKTYGIEAQEVRRLVRQDPPRKGPAKAAGLQIVWRREAC